MLNRFEAELLVQALIGGETPTEGSILLRQTTQWGLSNLLSYFQKSGTIETIVAAAGEATPDFTNTYFNTVTISEDTLINFPIGLESPLFLRSYFLRIIRSGTDPIVLTWDSAYLWPRGTIPEISDDDGAIDIISFMAPADDLLYGVYVHDMLAEPRP